MKLELWDRYHCIILLASAVFFVFRHNMLFIVAIALLSFAILIINSKDELMKLKPYGGWANRVTGIRLIGILVLALVNKQLTDWQITIWLALLIPLDGVDGLLARNRNEQTAMGAYFDMETDVLFVCVASCILFIRKLTGYEVLIMAFSRYFYVFIVYMCRLHHIKEQRTRIGPPVAVFIFSAVTLAFVVPDEVRLWVIYSAILLLIISFSYSFMLLLKQHRKNIAQPNF